MEFKVERVEDLKLVATQLLESFDDKIFIFYGDLGAGKTTLIKEICRQLGCIDEVSSPTFSLINEYITEKNEKIFHFDFYRINTPEEALDMGFEEYLDLDSHLFIEWPEKILKLIDLNYVVVEIKAEDQSRLIKVHSSDEPV